MYPTGKNGWKTELAFSCITFPLVDCRKTVLTFYLQSFDNETGSAQVTLDCGDGIFVNDNIDAYLASSFRIAADHSTIIPATCAPTSIQFCTLPNPRAKNTSEFQVIAVTCI